MVAAARGRAPGLSAVRRRRGRGRRGGPTLGPRSGRVSLRWEVGGPLILIGGMVAGLTLGVEGGALLFWGGTLVAGVGLGPLPPVT